MANTEEIRKTIASPENEEVAVLLESLDENSKVLAKTYLSALADRQRLEKARQRRQHWRRYRIGNQIPTT